MTLRLTLIYYNDFFVKEKKKNRFSPKAYVHREYKLHPSIYLFDRSIVDHLFRCGFVLDYFYFSLLSSMAEQLILRATLEGHNDWVTSVACSPNNDILVSGSRGM
jgi:WD40 repeat protein